LNTFYNKKNRRINMINEEIARLANEANSFDHYVEGSATAEYQSYINIAREIAEKQKAKAWQRQLTDKAIYAAKNLACICPTSTEN